MNKQLEALERLCDIALCGCSINEMNRIANYKYILTKALKRLELIDNKDSIIGPIEEIPTDILSKQLKALEIIKKKQVAVDEFLRCEDLEEYNDFAGDTNALTQEEYDIVKRALL
jgi:hypothetical protein